MFPYAAFPFRNASRYAANRRKVIQTSSPTTAGVCSARTADRLWGIRLRCEERARRGEELPRHKPCDQDSASTVIKQDRKSPGVRR